MTRQLSFIAHALAVTAFFTILFIVAERERAAEAKVALASAPAAEKAAPAPMPVVEITPERLARGKEIYNGMACVGCHSTDGTIRTGPSLAELYGKTEKLSDGTSVKVDESYLRDALFDPSGQVVHGFMATMPSYKGSMTDEDLAAMIAWIKSMQ